MTSLKKLGAHLKLRVLTSTEANHLKGGRRGGKGKPNRSTKKHHKSVGGAGLPPDCD